ILFPDRQQAGHGLGVLKPGLFHIPFPFRHLGKESGQHPAAFRCRLLVQLGGLFGLFPLELGEVLHLLLGELHMGHWRDAAVAGDGQQAFIGNGGMGLSAARAGGPSWVSAVWSSWMWESLGMEAAWRSPASSSPVRLRVSRSILHSRRADSPLPLIPALPSSSR